MQRARARVRTHARGSSGKHDRTSGFRARIGLKALLLGTSMIVATASAQADTVASDNDTIETVVVTGSAFNPDVAPAKASLATTQPQTIINKSYMEDSVAAIDLASHPQADSMKIVIQPGA